MVVMQRLTIDNGSSAVLRMRATFNFNFNFILILILFSFLLTLQLYYALFLLRPKDTFTIYKYIVMHITSVIDIYIIAQLLKITSQFRLVYNNFHHLPTPKLR